MIKFFLLSLWIISFQSLVHAANQVVPPHSCETRITTYNLNPADQETISKIIKNKGYIDVAGPGYVDNGEWDFGKSGFLWIYAGIDYRGSFPSSLQLDVTHSVYPPNQQNGFPLEVWYYFHQSLMPSIFGGNSRRVVRMIQGLPACKDLKIRAIKKCSTKGCDSYDP